MPGSTAPIPLLDIIRTELKYKYRDPISILTLDCILELNLLYFMFAKILMLQMTSA